MTARRLAPSGALVGPLLLLLVLPAAGLASGAGPVAAASPAWHQVRGTHPSQRDQLAMAYDPALKETVLFGGYNPGIYADNDTWVFAGGHWTDVSTSVGTAPAARWGASFAYDPALTGLVLFGGRGYSHFYNDTWLFNGTGWHALAVTGGAPAPRSGAGLAWDAAQHELILYGGAIGNVPIGSHSGPVFYNQTFALSGTAWKNLTATAGVGPGLRTDFQLTYDPVAGAIIGFAGAVMNPKTGVATNGNDTWEYRSGSWSLLSPSTAPDVPTQEVGIVWYPPTHSLLLFGAGGPGVVGNGTWEFRTASGWTNVTTTFPTPPPPRANFGFAYDAVAHRLVVYGGDPPGYALTYLDDTWTLR